MEKSTKSGPSEPGLYEYDGSLEQRTTRTSKFLTPQEYIKQRAEKSKGETRKMLMLLRKEELELETKCKKLIPEANKLCGRYCEGRQYEAKDGTAGTASEEFQVLVREDGTVVRSINSRSFMREYEKLANLKLRDQYRPHAVKDELRALLKNTTELTKQLENQLNELKRRGWNVPQE